VMLTPEISEATLDALRDNSNSGSSSMGANSTDLRRVFVVPAEAFRMVAEMSVSLERLLGTTAIGCSLSMRVGTD